MKIPKILMAAAEMVPFVKVGGLADVVGSLSMAMLNRSDVRVILPLYGLIDREKHKLQKKFIDIAVFFGDSFLSVNVWETKLKGVKVYFIECQKYFGFMEVYLPTDNQERYLFFSQAVLAVLPIIKFQPDIIHCHDYHTAMIPPLLKLSDDIYFGNIKTVLTIHNLQYQGITAIDVLSNIRFKHNSSIASAGVINFLAQGIIYADRINTVSPTYAKEIFGKEFGAGLEGLLRKNKNKISGILNGIDVDFFDPKKDKLIAKRFSVDDLSGKKINKAKLRDLTGLPQLNRPLVGLISRFVEQKGLELITEEIIKLNCQFIFLGTGDKLYENLLQDLARRFPEKVSVKIGFDLSLAQMIYAGADIFLMPSRFEPCGLGQMIAMRYGTVPVVRAVGGLADTVINYNLRITNYKSNGFSFKLMTISALKNTLKRALNTYEDKKVWQKIQYNGMKSDFSWDQSTQKYLELYQEII